MFDPEIMRQITLQLYAPKIERTYGTDGMGALRRLLEALNEFHRIVPYELMVGGVTIFSSLQRDPELPGLPGGVDLVGSQLQSRVTSPATLQILHGGAIRYWPLAGDLHSLAQVAVVYHFKEQDFFFLEGDLEPVLNPTGFPSVFGLPTFVELDEALRYYSDALARVCTCHILRACWHDEHRLLLINKPEVVMRRSLAQHLRSTLSKQLVELREEQNIDETHPIDIKVTWSLSNRIALIEVKWMGDSLNEAADNVGTTYRDVRAKAGARQLAEYLEGNHQNAPLHPTRGYLVVFDGRRKGVAIAAGDAISLDPWYFRDIEIEFDPRYELTRHDFAPPLRIFMEPALGVA